MHVRNLMLVPTLALVAACASESTPPVKPPDTTTDRAVFEDKALALTLEEGALAVELPIGNPGERAVSGTVKLALSDLGGDRIDTVRQAFTAQPGGSTVEVRLDGLPEDTTPAGLADYLITYEIAWDGGRATGTRSAFDALDKLQVVLMTESTVEFGKAQHVSLFALDPATAKPLADARVELRVQVGEAVSVRELVTDASGHAAGEVSLPEVDDEDMPEATLTVKVVAGEVSDVEELPLTIVRSRKVLLTTDKPLYQPGQTLHVRALALATGDKAPVAGKEAILEIEDAKGNKLTREIMTTDAFGIAATTFVIARQVNLGTWKVRVAIGDTLSEKTITVDRYVLPKFKVQANLDATWYRPGAEVTLSGEARYFFGKPVSQGHVAITASTFDVDFTPFSSVSTTTDEEGRFAARIQVPSHVVGLPLEQGKGLMKIDVVVTDGAEHSEVATKTATIAKGAVDVALVPESGRLVAGVDNTIFVVTTDPNGGPVAAAVELEIDGEKATLATDAHGLGEIVIVPEGEGSVQAKVTVTAGGDKLSFERALALGSDVETVLVRSDKAIYAVGDSATVEVRVADLRDKVWVDVVHGGRTAMLETLPVVDGRASWVFDVDGTLAGEMQIGAWYLTDAGTLVRDQRLVFVQPDNELSVTMTPERESYLPGESATVAVKVTDQGGRGVAAAVGVQVVDEAVFALQETQPGLLKVFFELARELAAPMITTGCGSCDATNIIRGDEAGTSGYDQKARVAFSALSDQPLHGVEKNTFSDEVAAVKAVLKPRFDAERQRIIDEISDRAALGIVTEENVVDMLSRSEIVGVDMWGHPYAMDYDATSQQATYTSRGPDERAGSVDDMSFALTTWEALYKNGWGRGWDDDFAEADGGGPWPGAMDPNAGGPPQDGGGTVTGGTGGPEEGGGAVRVRQDFPETLYVNPALITDGNGEAELTLDLADSITTWRMTGLASSKDGLLGSGTGGLTVFQDFFVDVDFPVAVTRNDVLRVPIAVYNYLPTAQEVTLDLEAPEVAGWYEALEGTHQTLTLGPNEVRAAHFAIRATAVGRQALTVLARGSSKSDAVRRGVEVRPDGKAIIETTSARFAASADGQVARETVRRTVMIPEANIDGAQELLVKVYPGFMSQVVEGMDSLLRLPGGCFEQTTSTAWPNVLATDYLSRTGALTEAIDIKARTYITEGYQRLLTFECASGGFNWWEGDDPGNAVLTAVGVMMFTDTKNVAFVDDEVIVRAAKYLAQTQQSDGSWSEERHLHAGNENLGAGSLRASAYITWALLHAEREPATTDKALAFLRSQATQTDDVYTTALVTLALATKNPNDPLIAGLAEKLHDARVEEGQRVYWEPDEQTMVGGWDDSGKIETTAVVALALMQAGAYATDVGGAIDWLLSKKDPNGNWGYSTQATVLTLKALIASLSNGAASTDATVRVLLDGEEIARRDFDDLNADVLWQVDLGAQLGEGEHEVAIDYEGVGNLMWQVASTHYLPWDQAPEEPAGPLAITVDYDKTELATDDVIQVTVTVTNSDPNETGMMMAELGLPPGFELDASALDAVLGLGQVARYERTPLRLVVYLEPIRPEQPVIFGYALRATEPLEATAPESEAYLYYNRSVRAETAPVRLVVGP